jgi:preprotein translocase subunit SecA
MAAKIANAGPDNWRRVEKGIVLQIYDQHWKEHLLNLDHLRQGINLRAFGQRDPLNEYKTEAFAMFENMLNLMRESITMMLSLVEVNVGDDRIGVLMPGATPPQKMQETRQDPALMGTGFVNTKNQQMTEQKRVEPFPQKKKFDKNDPDTWGKVQRNADCPCGSGKKYKHCHGNIAQKA